LARIAAGDNLVIVDMEHDAGFLYDDTDMEDMLHPNTLGYQKMALGWFDKMTEILPQISYKPEIKIPPIDTGSVNKVYNSRIFAIGNPAPSYSLISAPTGMTIDPITGSISWTPLSTGNYSVSVLVSNTHGSDTASWILRITEIGFNHCNETFTALTGTITDNSGGASYDNNMSCQKLIQPVNAASITLVFNSFATESGYDFVSIYNGATTSSPLLGRYSGTTIPPALTSTGGTMLIVFTSDYSVVAAGWSASFTTTTTMSLLEPNGTLKVVGLGSDATRREPFLLAYPNPTSDVLTVETNYKEVKTFIIELSNASGQVLLNQRLEVINGKFELDISGYDYGFYLLKITIDNAVHSVRVLKD
jgi:hypothetical protein